MPGGWAPEADAWLSWLRASGKPQTTLKLRRTQLRRLAETHPGADPYTLTTDQLGDWLGSHHWSAETLRSHRAMLRSFYAWAHSTGRTRQNPAALLPTVAPKVGRPRPAPEMVIRTSRLAAGERDELMIRLAAEAGLRCCEICRVHTDDVEPVGEDPAGCTLHALRVLGKGSRERVVPLAPGLAAVLQARERGWVFPGRIDGHLSPGYVSKRLSAALSGPYTGHQLRHRFASVAYAAERDLRAVQELLGHTMPETTARYTAIPDNALRAAVLAAAS